MGRIAIQSMFRLSPTFARSILIPFSRFLKVGGNRENMAKLMV